MITGPGGPGLPRRAPVTRQQIRPGTVRRIIPYVKPLRWAMAVLLVATAVDAFVTVANPLVLAAIIDQGILRRNTEVVILLALAIGGLAVVDAVAMFVQGRYSARIGQGLIYDLRTKAFRHVLKQPLAFFTRAQTGSLVSRLNTDVVGAQQAVTGLLSQSVATVLTLIMVLIAMFYLSWQLTIVALLLTPVFVFPGKPIGKRLQRFTREQMQLNAEMSSMMNERFNVAGAILTKLYGRPAEESTVFADRAARVRDIAVRATVWGRALGITIGLISASIFAVVFGFGGVLVIRHVFQVGTLVALITLLQRLYGPIGNLSGLQVNVLTALVSFDRVFEVMDLKPLVAERLGAVSLPSAGSGNEASPDIEFDRVWFRYPPASQVSLSTLESVALPAPERTDDTWALTDVSFCAPAGQLTALVGPSGAGKTTISHLVPRLYDPSKGAVRINGCDIRDVTLASLHDAVGVVTQDAHLFHDTIRLNLEYARPGASERELIDACKAAQIWDLISTLPNGLDTVVGDRGFRLSGGEKQRVAIARLLLKAPSVVVLDEATAHLDSESEAAIQRALKTALAGRTSLVIAHRLSTIREADQILVVDSGKVRERGTHQELLKAGGLYAELYRTQFATQAANGAEDPAAPARDDALPALHPADTRYRHALQQIVRLARAPEGATVAIGAGMGAQRSPDAQKVIGEMVKVADNALKEPAS
jgi:ATP-binding cassette, subfamily B, bacterial